MVKDDFLWKEYHFYTFKCNNRKKFHQLMMTNYISHGLDPNGATMSLPPEVASHPKTPHFPNQRWQCFKCSSWLIQKEHQWSIETPIFIRFTFVGSLFQCALHNQTEIYDRKFLDQTCFQRRWAYITSDAEAKHSWEKLLKLNQ